MKNERIEEIANLLDQRGKLSLRELNTFFPNVSEMTLRRDLLYLEKKDRVVRIRGGAMSVNEIKKVSGEKYVQKTVIHTDEKREIAQKVVSLIEEDSCIFLDGGTTAMYFAKELPVSTHCHVFTNGIAVAMELAQKKNVQVTFVGGELLKENLSTASSAAKIYLEHINFSVAILSASAFTVENGFSCGTQGESDLLHVIREKSHALYMMLDSSKIGKIKPYTFARIEDIDVLITDDSFPEEVKAAFKAKNIVVL